MTVKDFIDRLAFGTQKVRITNMQNFCYFEGSVTDLVCNSPVIMRKIKNLSVLAITATTSNGKVWVNVTVAD